LSKFGSALWEVTHKVCFGCYPFCTVVVREKWGW